jgi:phosphatidylinositol alpha 1,6-mannosyltransferase
MGANIRSPATLNLAPTDKTAEYLRMLKVPSVDVWGRGVDLDLYHPNRRNEAKTQEFRKQWAPNGEKIVGYVGRLAAEKQVHRMAELMDIPNTRFVLVGAGPELARLKFDFAGKPVTFAGRLTGVDLASAYAAFDAFVHFGTEETFGQTIQEAQASGLPLVAPNSGGPMFLVEHGQTGYLAHPTKKHAFTPFVKELLADDTLRAQIGEQARRSVLKKSWEANNAKLLDYYARAIELNALKKAKSLELA